LEGDDAGDALILVFPSFFEVFVDFFFDFDDIFLYWISKKFKFFLFQRQNLVFLTAVIIYTSKKAYYDGLSFFFY
jgi:hypothetical protein